MRPLILLAALGLSGCFLKPYEVDLVQGNRIPAEEIAALTVGLSQTEVLQRLGTPLLQDPFHPDRWDYLYRHKKRNGKICCDHLTLYFKEGVLTRIVPEISPT